MLTINADNHEVMKHFHKPTDEKHSIVVLDNSDYIKWPHADHEEARQPLRLAQDGFFGEWTGTELVLLL